MSLLTSLAFTACWKRTSVCWEGMSGSSSAWIIVSLYFCLLRSVARGYDVTRSILDH